MKEEKILKKVLSGDQTAFTELVEKYWDAVFSSAFSILHNIQESEEITQEVFLKIYTHLNQLKEREFFSSWLKKISFNMAINRLRKKAGLSCVSFSEVDPSDIASPPADEELLRKEIVDEILLALSELSDEESDILSEHLLEGKEYSELSEEYGLSYHAVVMRIKRAKEKVKKKVLKRLGGIIILPWKEIAKVIGGVALKLKTLVTITVTALVMLAGVGIFLTHKSEEEKPAAKVSDVKVERQFFERAPASVSVSKQKPKEEQKVEQYSEQEIEEALAWLDSLEEESSTESESSEVLESTERQEKENDKPSERKILGLSVEEAHRKAVEVKKQLEEMLYTCIDMEEEILSGIAAASKIPDKEVKEREFERLRKLALEEVELAKKYLELESYYLPLSENWEALEPGGWIYELKQKLTVANLKTSYR